MRNRLSIWAAVVVIAIGLAVVVVRRFYFAPRSIVGVTLIQNADARRQAPIPDVDVTAVVGEQRVRTKSDNGGAFSLILPRELWRRETIELQFERSGYQPLKISKLLRNNIYVVRMTAVGAGAAPALSGPEATIKDVRVRYAAKATTPINVGSIAKTFEVVNLGDIPCDRSNVCSPDRKWKAAEGGITLDASDGHQFQNVRISCIAGPCPFTRIESNQSSRGGQIVKVLVRAWSDAVTFLVEAEVMQTLSTDLIRNAYPAIFGREMSFTLPATTQGPSIQADTNGTEIVYPLGPELTLSWAACTLQLAADKTRLYRCELKPGYRFQ